MDYALDRFTQEIRASLRNTERVPEEFIDIQFPKAKVPADMAFPAFRAAKALNIQPPQLAKELAATMRVGADSLVGSIETSGPFLNFVLHPQRLAVAVLSEVKRLGDQYGHDDLGHNKSMIIDYSSPNVAKRMHVGHIRSTIIGQALVHIFRALGYEVIGDNHLGDWGTQFGAILAAMQREGKPQAEGEAALAAIEDLYSRFNKEMEHNPDLRDEARSWSLRLEQGDPQARELWRWCVDITLQANQQNYDRLGAQFDHAYGESFYESMLPAAVQDALDSGAAQRDDDGSIAVRDIAPKIDTFPLQRSDGGTLYITRDVATIKFRMQEFQPDQIVYVVGTRQELHFRQLFALVRAMGYVPDHVDLVHVSFGDIVDVDGQALSTRRGNMVFLSTLLDEARTRARNVVEEKSPDLSDEEKTRVAELVGVGAVIYNDLYQDVRRTISLDWDRMLATEGNSATYLQYSHARCRSILRKASENGAIGLPALQPEWLELLTHPSEQQLIKHLARLPEAVREAGARYTPFVIADWCYTTAREFGVFFEQCPVLRAESPELRNARLVLVEATAQALKNGLALLGIKAPERM